MQQSDILGTLRVRKLIFMLGWPAALNFLVVAIYNLTDVFFVGRYLGSVQIAAVGIVGTIVFLLSSFGLAIGVGGSSVIARALGEKNRDKASFALINQNILSWGCHILLVATGWLFRDQILLFFGAKGEIFTHAVAYYNILLFGVPFLSWSMMGNHVIHTMGHARIAMMNGLLPTIVNTALNPLFIKTFGWGIEGSAWATIIGYSLNALLVLRFFASAKNEIALGWQYVKLKWGVIREMASVGAAVLLDVFTTNLFTIVLNQILFRYEQEAGVIIISIILRMNLLFLIPVIGLESGIRPIIGYNFGSRQMHRVRQALLFGLQYGILIIYGLYGLVVLTSPWFIQYLTTDSYIAAETLRAVKIIYSFFPLMIIQVVASSYFQAIGRPKTAFFLTVLKNIVLLIPLLYVFAYYFGYQGILYTFPLVDIVSAATAFWLLRNELQFKLAKGEPAN